MIIAGRDVFPVPTDLPAKSSTVLWHRRGEVRGSSLAGSPGRKHPELRLLTVSPGNTQGTEIASAMPTPVRILMQRIMMPIVTPLLGLAHSLERGAGRIVAGLTEPSFQSGVFYASAGKKLTGPVMDQSQIFPDLAKPTYQQNADEAIHRFL